MRIVGRYFGVGATLGSVTSLVTLVLIWSWLTIHLGLLGFLVGWIPAGLAAAAVWLVMVVFWGPILVVGVMVAVALLAWTLSGGRQRAWREPPAASEPEEVPVPAPPPAEPPPAEAEPYAQHDQGEAPPEFAPSPPPTPPSPETESSAPETAPAPPPRAAPRRPSPHDDLNADADAAGNTSRSRPQ